MKPFTVKQLTKIMASIPAQPEPMALVVDLAMRDWLFGSIELAFSGNPLCGIPIYLIKSMPDYTYSFMSVKAAERLLEAEKWVEYLYPDGSTADIWRAIGVVNNLLEHSTDYVLASGDILGGMHYNKATTREENNNGR